MEEYGRLILFATLVCGFGPVFLIGAFCLLTGRARWLFSKNQDIDSAPRNSVALTILHKLAMWLFPAYLVLLCLVAYLGFR